MNKVKKLQKYLYKKNNSNNDKNSKLSDFYDRGEFVFLRNV